MYFESQISGAGRVSRSSVPGAILSGSRDLLDSLRLFFDILMIWNVTNGSETARRLKMHRRTLQRILSKRSPR
jgi:hypothetical protein